MAVGAPAGFAPWSVLAPPAGTCVQPYALDPCAFLQGACASLTLHPIQVESGKPQGGPPFHTLVGYSQPRDSQGELLLGSMIIRCFQWLESTWGFLSRTFARGPYGADIAVTKGYPHHSQGQAPEPGQLCPASFQGSCCFPGSRARLQMSQFCWFYTVRGGGGGTFTAT